MDGEATRPRSPLAAVVAADSMVAQESEKQMDDPFASLFNLEEQYQAEGYAKGEADGAVAGRSEGRVFGMQRGFERFSEMGWLHAQAAVLQARLRQGKLAKHDADRSLHEFAFFDIGQGEQIEAGVQLRKISGKRRLELNAAKLYSLTEPESLSFENNEDDVRDFDERLSTAQSTSEIIRRALGEENAGAQVQDGGRKEARPVGTDIEDVDVSRLIQRKRRDG